MKALMDFDFDQHYLKLKATIQLCINSNKNLLDYFLFVGLQ